MGRVILIVIAALIVVGVLGLVSVLKKDVFRVLKERAERKEREKQRQLAFTRSKELLQYLLADAEVAVLVRDGLIQELNKKSGNMLTVACVAWDQDDVEYLKNRSGRP